MLHMCALAAHKTMSLSPHVYTRGLQLHHWIAMTHVQVMVMTHVPGFVQRITPHTICHKITVLPEYA